MSSNTPLNARTDAILRRLVRREAGPALRKVLHRTRAEDIAAVIENLTWTEQRRLYQAVEDRDKAAEILAMLPEDSIRRVTNEMTEEFVADLLDRLEADDATDVVSALADDVRARVLAGMNHEDQTELAALLEWPADSAGGIMSTEFMAMPDTATCGEAIRTIQRTHDEIANAHYVYVLGDDGQLKGVASLRQLVVHPPNTPLVAVMTRDAIMVRPQDDQEEVARYVARYDLLAIPVVDDHGRLLGIVTVDDVVDVIREEAAEDMYKMAGLSDAIDPSVGASVFTQVWQRAGWLLATIGGGILAAEIIGTYEATLARVAVLAGFIPVIMGMGGNVGIQSATVAVRGLATGHVQLGGALAFVWREVRVGFLLGILYGALLAVYGLVRYPDRPLIGVSIGVSIFSAITGAALFGAGIPVFLSRLRIDPAVATGPMVTTLVDLIAILVYFNIARMLLGI